MPNDEGKCPYIENHCSTGAPSPAIKDGDGKTIQGKIHKCCETYFQGEDNCNECLRSVGCDLPPPPPSPTPPPPPSIMPVSRWEEGRGGWVGNSFHRMRGFLYNEN
jgi:hypothetical protein